MQICKNCRQLFDPTLTPEGGDQFIDDFLCSYHPGETERTGNTGPRFDYADVYRWSCCGKTHVGGCDKRTRLSPSPIPRLYEGPPRSRSDDFVDPRPCRRTSSTPRAASHLTKLIAGDEKDLLVGEVIDAAISHGIQTNALFLIVLSPSSITSAWVRRELDEAAHEATAGQKVLLPVLADGLHLDSTEER